MTTPFPGFAAPSPRTWSKADLITAARLRGDMTDLAALFAGGARPILAVQYGPQSIPSGSATQLIIVTTTINTWNVTAINTAGTNVSFQVPLAGYYLVQGNVMFSPLNAGDVQFRYVAGSAAVINGAAAARSDGGAVPASTGVNIHVGPGACELYQMNTYANTSDTLALYAFQNTGGTFDDTIGQAIYEWVALPTSGLTSYTGPYGTVVASPQAAAAFPSGPGTTILNAGGIAAGATSVTVADATGMITGGTLGLDYISGTPYQPAAEPVSITSVAGTTIGISATSFAHLQGAPVAVPVSAAFLNQQDRDVVNFLAYPPMCRAVQQSLHSLTSTSLPTGHQITSMAATVDNFSGFASNAYTAPVAGVYFVYGQVYFAGSTAAAGYSAGIQVASGTINWGSTFYSDTSSGVQTFCATVRRHLRLTAGQAITLWGQQSSGAGMNTVVVTGAESRLIAVWRSV